jgi:protein-glutamine gamma-glutamyltransferase
LLFYVFPRIDPLWRIPSLTKGNITLEDRMNPGSISGMFGDDTTAMQITFANQPIIRGYWRGIILSYYNGETWYQTSEVANDFRALPAISRGDTPDYDILLEPTHKRFLYYDGYLVASNPSLLFSPTQGLRRYNKAIINNRFGYAGKVGSAPYQSLSRDEIIRATQLPGNSNLRLKAWAQQAYANSNHDTQAFITFLREYIHQQEFWYTLNPPPLGYSSNQMDRFWFDNKKGFCEHYASAVTFILRSAGIPARIVLGYYGGKWNPITRTVTIAQNNAHAWLEYWQDGVGWQKLDPTAFIATSRIDTVIYNRNTTLSAQSEYLTFSDIPWRQRISLMMDSVVFYSERWFMLYNQNTQQSLLQKLGIGNLPAEKLLQITVTTIPVIFILMGFYYQWRQRRDIDPLTREYHYLQDKFRSLEIMITPSDTLKHQCDLLAKKYPNLLPVLNHFLNEYEHLRLMLANGNNASGKRDTILLFKSLRRRL